MFDSLSEWWFTLEAWWHDLTPDSQAFLVRAGVLLGVFLAGEVAGRAVRRRLRAGDFDGWLRAPWLPAPGGGRAASWLITPSGLVSGLMRLSIWGAGVWWLSSELGWTALAATLEWAAGRVWALAAMVVVALALARFFAGQVVEFLQTGPLSEKLDAWLPRAGGLREPREPRVSSVAALAGTAVYGVVFLLLLLVVAELFDWTLAGSALAAAWSVLLHVVTAGTALLIGWLGFRWTRVLTLSGTETASLPTRAAHYAGLTIVAGATLLAIALLAATTQAVVVVIAALCLALVLWPLRVYVADMWAGMLLTGQHVQQVRLDGEVSEVDEVGLLTTRLHRQEEQIIRRNGLVLQAHLQTASKPNGVERRPATNLRE